MTLSIKAVGFLELNSIAKGIEAADAMLKAAPVEMYLASPTCPGKYIALVYGELAAVEKAIAAGISVGGEQVIDDLIIPDIDEQIFPAITGTSAVDKVDAVGVIESLSLASLIVAADAATKEVDVQIIEIRLGAGIGGKSFVTLTGAVDAIEVAVSNGVEAIRETGNLVYSTVIASPHEELARLLL
jgi:microcompartment protein CcmL/EutN